MNKDRSNYKSGNGIVEPPQTRPPVGAVFCFPMLRRLRKNANMRTMKVRKRYVTVMAVFGEDGCIAPTAIILDDKQYIIDQIIGASRAASHKAGGCGWRYTIRIRDHITYLWLEGPRWFVEEQIEETEEPIEYDRIDCDEWMIDYRGHDIKERMG